MPERARPKSPPNATALPLGWSVWLTARLYARALSFLQTPREAQFDELSTLLDLSPERLAVMEEHVGTLLTLTTSIFIACYWCAETLGRAAAILGFGDARYNIAPLGAAACCETVCPRYRW